MYIGIRRTSRKSCHPCESGDPESENFKCQNLNDKSNPKSKKPTIGGATSAKYFVVGGATSDSALRETSDIFHVKIADMITVAEVEKLAQLARIKLDPAEKEGLTKEIDSILAYVDQIKKADVQMDAEGRVGSVKNVMRPDEATATLSEDRERLLDEAPDREGDFVAVKKIIAQD